MTDFTRTDTDELVRELARRENEQIKEFVALAPTLTDEELQTVVGEHDCDFERIRGYSSPAYHCKGCVAEATLHERKTERNRREREKPGELPTDCNSASSGDVSDLKKGDVLERKLYPGASDFDHVQVVSVTTSKDGGKFRRVEFQRTNDPDSKTFFVDYPRDAFIDTIWRDWRNET